MKRFFIYALLFAAAFSLDSCREKSQVDELKDFIEEVKDKGSSYTEEQWEEANKKFSALLGKAKDAKDLSEDELREIARLQGEYASAAFKEHAGKVIEKAGDVIDKTGAAIDGFVDGLKSDDKPKDK